MRNREQCLMENGQSKRASRQSASHMRCQQMASISASGCNSSGAPSGSCTSNMLGAPASIHSILFNQINGQSLLTLKMIPEESCPGRQNQINNASSLLLRGRAASASDSPIKLLPSWLDIRKLCTTDRLYCVASNNDLKCFHGGHSTL